MMNKLSSILRVLTLCVSLTFIGCQGGGTQGTGVPKSLYTGRLTTADGKGFSGAQLVISESGATTQSDEHGNFELESDPQTPTVTFVVTRAQFQATAVLDNVPVDNKPVTVEISVDVENNSADARLITLSGISKFDLKAVIVGNCSQSFTNLDDEIHQTNLLPNGISCLAHVEVRGDGQLKGGVKVAVQRKPCRDHALWTTTEVRITGTSVRTGQAIVPFRLFDTERACAYRIVAPFGQDSNSVDVLPIVTLGQLKAESDGL